FFLLPFDLISVHHTSATMAGAVFVPFTLIMAALSRWSGGLLDRFGARLPLVVGPSIVAAGFVLFALAGPAIGYALAFLLPGLGGRAWHGGDRGAAHDGGDRRRARPPDRRRLGHQQCGVL